MSVPSLLLTRTERKNNNTRLTQSLDRYCDAHDIGGAVGVTSRSPLTGDEYDGGYALEPIVFAEVDPEMRIAREEVFGPVLSVIPVSDFEEGPSASIVTDDLTEANPFVDFYTTTDTVCMN